MILGIDIGTRTTTVASVEEIYTVESRLMEKTEINSVGNKNELIIHNGKEYFLNDGIYENNLFKYEKENFELLLNYTVTKAAKNNDKVKVCFGIPVSQYNNIENRNKMKEKINQNKICTIGYLNKAGDYDYKTVTIEDFIIRPEGYGIYTALRSQPGTLDLSAKTILCDIGGKTIDITYYDVNGKIIDGLSLPYGLTRYFELIKNTFNLTVEDAEKFARGLYKPKDLDKLAYKPIEEKMFNIILNDIQANFDNINRYNFIICGGGAKFFDLYFKDKGINTIVDSDVASNAKTFYMLGREKFEKRS